MDDKDTGDIDIYKIHTYSFTNELFASSQPVVGPCEL